MKKIIITLISCFILSGCSLIPKVNFDTPNTVPQSIDKSKTKDVCKGEAKFNESGDMIYCSKGYYSYNENYDKKERRMTIVEKIKSYINNLVGWSFWIFVALIFLCPSLIGVIFGRLIEGTIGIATKTLKSVVRGVQKARKNGEDLNIALSTELDTNNKKYIAKIKEKEKIK
jgi:hypothetical protein